MPSKKSTSSPSRKTGLSVGMPQLEHFFKRFHLTSYEHIETVEHYEPCFYPVSAYPLEIQQEILGFVDYHDIIRYVTTDPAMRPHLRYVCHDLADEEYIREFNLIKRMHWTEMEPNFALYLVVRTTVALLKYGDDEIIINEIKKQRPSCLVYITVSARGRARYDDGKVLCDFAGKVKSRLDPHRYSQIKIEPINISNFKDLNSIDFNILELKRIKSIRFENCNVEPEDMPVSPKLTDFESLSITQTRIPLLRALCEPIAYKANEARPLARLRFLNLDLFTPPPYVQGRTLYHHPYIFLSMAGPYEETLPRLEYLRVTNVFRLENVTFSSTLRRADIWTLLPIDHDTLTVKFKAPGMRYCSIYYPADHDLVYKVEGEDEGVKPDLIERDPPYKKLIQRLQKKHDIREITQCPPYAHGLPCDGKAHTYGDFELS